MSGSLNLIKITKNLKKLIEKTMVYTYFDLS